MSIHLGVNRYDHPLYVRRPTTLTCAELDAGVLAALAAAQGVSAHLLLGPDVTRANTLELFARAQTLASGALLILTFSGHGARLRDLAPSLVAARPASARNLMIDDEVDGMDELWCLHDGFLLDDELNQHLALLAPGVRVLAISDSCHSGTMLRPDDVLPAHLRRRFYRKEDAQASFAANVAVYAQLVADAASAARSVAASVIHYAACGEDSVAFEGRAHGVFTEAIVDVWANGAFDGDHRAFLDAVAARTRPRQVPVFSLIGPRDLAFETGRPFTR